ncbi:MAG: putative rane protein [Firmicutes bacterium]|nr:putative rane protein [Bacillota bacterium]
MTEIFAAVNVPLAVLWSEPGPKRPHDNLILEPVTNPLAWADTMDDEMRLWLVGKVETQLLYGERLLILERHNDWIKVAAVEQTTSLNTHGYPGWLPAAQVRSDIGFLEDQLHSPLLTITAAKAPLYQDNASICELSYQTRLPLVTAEDSEYYSVRLPSGNVGHIYRSQAMPQTKAPFSAQAIVTEARKFLGLRYIWGGTSAFGFDCSGFVMRLYASQEIFIPRDADDQASGGSPVDKADLELGDLLFFANANGQGAIHHVGLYSGDDRMIHAPNSRSAIREEQFTVGSYGDEYWGARRYR